MTYDKDTITFHPLSSNPRFIDLTGVSVGRLVVIGFAGIVNKITYWFCECSCGTIACIKASNLRNGHAQSCGCLKKECRRTHGKYKTAEYRTYHSAKGRCRTASDCSPIYSDRGIEFRFKSFEEFYAELGDKPTPKHSLDRIDNDGHYEPGNVRWATAKTQLRNTRRTKYITINGISKCYTDWAREMGLGRNCIYQRITRGWNPVDAVMTPQLRRNQ